MDRRTFIDAGAGAGLLSAVAMAQSSPLAGLAIPSSAGPEAGPEDLDEYLAGVDDGLAAIADGDLSDFLPGEGRSLGDKTELARGALRALYLTAMVGDLPYTAQTDPRVQERLWGMAPEVDETFRAMNAHLEEVTSSEWVDLQTRLRDRTNPGIAVAQALTREGAMAGVSRRRRLQTRAMITHLTLRLRSQPPDVVMQEYRTKVDRVVESDGTDAAARRSVAAHLGEKAFVELGKLGANEELPAGVKTLGWGFAITAVGAVIVLAGAFPGVFVMTVGVVFMLIGLIQLIFSVLF